MQYKNPSCALSLPFRTGMKFYCELICLTGRWRVLFMKHVDLLAG